MSNFAAVPMFLGPSDALPHEASRRTRGLVSSWPASRSILICFVVALVGLIAARRGQAGEREVPYDEALELIRANEALFRNAAWSTTLQEGKSATKDGANIQFKGTPATAEATVDNEGGRYSLREKATIRWLQGADDHMSMDVSTAFDGASVSLLEYNLPGDKLPRPGKTPGRGSIYHEGRPNGRPYEVFARSSGIAHFPPRFEGERLSEALARAADSGDLGSIIDRGDGVWSIHRLKVKDGGPDDFLDVEYDAARANVVAATWSNGDPPTPFLRTTVELTQAAGGLWAPKRETTVNVFDGLASVRTYNNIRINQTIPDDAFVLHFPAGTLVTDYVKGRTYRAGAGVEDDAESVRRFMAENSPASRPESPEQSSKFKVLFVVNALIAIAVMALIFLRKRWARGATTGLVMLLLPTLGGDATADDRDGMGGRAAPVVARQCGHMVTFFALESMNREYRPSQVEELLPPDDDGVRLVDIARLLEANLLKVETRRVPNFSELNSCLVPGRVLIIPYRVSEGLNHCLAGASLAGRGKLIIDVPRSVNPFEKLRFEWDERSIGHVVLVVDPPDEHDEVDASLSVDPQVVDLGTVNQGDPICSTPLRKTVTLRNNRDRHLLVKQVQGTCGCLQLDWAGGLLAPHEERRLSFKVLLNTFAAGPSVRQIVLALPDGATKVVSVQANMVPAHVEQGLIVTPKSLRCDITDFRPGEAEVGELLVQTRTGEPTDGVAMESDSPWLQCRVKNRNGPSTVISVVAKIDELTDERIKNTRSIEGRVYLSSHFGKSRVPFEVILFRRATWPTVPPVVRCVRTASDKYAFSIQPRADFFKGMKVLRAWAESRDVKVTYRRKSDAGVYDLTVDFGGVGSQVSWVIVRCLLEGDDGRRDVARVPVFLAGRNVDPDGD